MWEAVNSCLGPHVTPCWEVRRRPDRQRTDRSGSTPGNANNPIHRLLPCFSFPPSGHSFHLPALKPCLPNLIYTNPITNRLKEPLIRVALKSSPGCYLVIVASWGLGVCHGDSVWRCDSQTYVGMTSALGNRYIKGGSRNVTEKRRRGLGLLLLHFWSRPPGAGVLYEKSWNLTKTHPLYTP